MGSLRNTYSVLSTIQATAADISVVEHVLSITGCPSMDYRRIENVGNKFVESLDENPQIRTVTFTAAASTLYQIAIQQFVKSAGKTFTEILSYTTAAAGDTANTICNAMRSQLASLSTIQITGSGTATLILTAKDGSPLFTITNISPATTTQATSMWTATVTAATNATPVVATVGAVDASIVVGSTVTVTGGTTNTGVNGTFRVSAVTGTTITLEGSVGNGTYDASSATIVGVAQVARGQGADLIAAGVTTAVSGSRYSQVPFTYVNRVGALMGNTESEVDTHTLYVLETATNYAAFSTRIGEVINAFVASGTTSDPKLIAL